MSQPNPVTGKNQHIDISKQQEIALGLQAAPEMAAQYGGEDTDQRADQIVEDVGKDVVAHSEAGQSDWKFQFHCLADPNTINAFALPGGQVFITHGLLSKLKTRGEIAGVLGHECGHVLARHSAEHMAKARLTQGLTGAAVIATTDPSNPSTYKNAAIAAMIGQLVNLRFSRQDESEADKLGVRLMSEAGYDPRSMIKVMEVLKQVGGSGGPEFFQTHPSPANRIQQITQDIKDRFPNGVPGGLKP
jgi:predicted Zn-dependent protease